MWLRILGKIQSEAETAPIIVRWIRDPKGSLGLGGRVVGVRDGVEAAPNRGRSG